MDFSARFFHLTGHQPLRWQRRFFERLLRGDIPTACDLPTGTGKTSVIALWYLARSAGAPLPRRLVYVVDRRVVVDQASEVAEQLRREAGDDALRISTLRGRHQDNREWLEDPAALAIIVGTVDMIGSRLLFSGYGVSRKMAPYHAGMLGADALFVTDESHLVPPFLHLMRSVAQEPRADCVPGITVLPLSATGRDPGADVFALEPEDLQDAFICNVVNAEKRLRAESGGDSDLDHALAQRARELAEQYPGTRIAVFCSKRTDAEKIAVKLGKADKALLTGARRVRERERAQAELQQLGFLGPRQTRDAPAFLVATAAGEVGIDLDADHMVCDLVAWERMVQRLGRVNRRGGEGRAAEVVVVDQGPPKQSKKPTEDEKTDLSIYQATKTLLSQAGDASPSALRSLADRESALTAAASTPEPLRPELTHPLVEAWSLTSLEEHTGRPQIAPWLRGWVRQDPQTTLIWRTFLPSRASDAKRYLQEAPPHVSEGLETETWAVIKWLASRVKGRTGEEPVAFALRHGDTRAFKSSELAPEGEARKQLVTDLAGAVLIVAADLGGLSEEGLLNEAIAVAAVAADSAEPETWAAHGASPVPFRVQKNAVPPTGGEWKESWRCPTRWNDDGDAIEWLSVQTLLSDGEGDDAAAEGREQLLSDHVAAVERHVAAITAALAIPDDVVGALALAAHWHDEGKRATRWQRAFRARDERVWAKTRGPINFALLDHYRHEFGSLLEIQDRAAADDLAPGLRDLVLHLVAAHHGWARPIIGTSGCERLPPSALQAQAQEVALRFARLQEQWGPWGLAWLEALLRAADQAASRENDRDDRAEGIGAV